MPAETADAEGICPVAGAGSPGLHAAASFGKPDDGGNDPHLPTRPGLAPGPKQTGRRGGRYEFGTNRLDCNDIQQASRRSGQQAVGREDLAEFVSLAVFQGDHRQTHFVGGHLEHGHRGLDRDGVGRQAQQTLGQREELVVPLAGRDKIAFQDQVGHGLDIGGDDVGDDADDALAADGGDGQRERIVAGEDRQVAAGGDLAGLVERAGGFLDGDDVVESRESRAMVSGVRPAPQRPGML